jgi:hypothetical protein
MAADSGVSVSSGGTSPTSGAQRSAGYYKFRTEQINNLPLGKSKTTLSGGMEGTLTYQGTRSGPVPNRLPHLFGIK